MGDLLGARCADKSSMEWVLKRPEKGHALALIVGAEMEILDGSPGRFVLYVKPRYGFLKLALKHG